MQVQSKYISGIRRRDRFQKFANAFLASQVEDSYRHDGSDTFRQLRNSDGKWDTRGHRDRIVNIDRAALAAIHALTENERSR